MMQPANTLLPDAADLPLVDQAAGILMDLLHCGQDEAMALLRAQSLAVGTGIDDVARSFVAAA